MVVPHSPDLSSETMPVLHRIAGRRPEPGARSKNFVARLDGTVRTLRAAVAGITILRSRGGSDRRAATKLCLECLGLY